MAVTGVGAVADARRRVRQVATARRQGEVAGERQRVERQAKLAALRAEADRIRLAAAAAHVRRDRVVLASLVGAGPRPDSALPEEEPGAAGDEPGASNAQADAELAALAQEREERVRQTELERARRAAVALKMGKEAGRLAREQKEREKWEQRDARLKEFERKKKRSLEEEGTRRAAAEDAADQS
jgi:hypothetical protein